MNELVTLTNIAEKNTSAGKVATERPTSRQVRPDTSPSLQNGMEHRELF
jgi:hypothetical protein